MKIYWGDILFWGFILTIVAIAFSSNLWMPMLLHWRSAPYVAESENIFRTQGYAIIEGEVESPAVVIRVDNRDAFLKKATELGTTTIYKELSMLGSTRFYVFDEDYNVGYRWTIY